MSSDPSNIGPIPPEMRGVPPSRPDQQLIANMDAFSQAMQNQLEELNKLLQEITKAIQNELKSHPSAKKTIVNEGQSKINEAIQNGLQNIQNDLIDQFPAPRVPASHIDHFIQEQSILLHDQYNAKRLAAVAGEKKQATPFEMFQAPAKPSKAAKKAQARMPAAPAPKPPMPKAPAPGAGFPGAGASDESMQQFLANFFQGQGGGGAAPAGNVPSFDAQFVLGLIQQFIGTSNSESKQVLFQQIQMAMNQGQSTQGAGPTGIGGGATGPSGAGLPSIYGGLPATNFGAPPTTIAQALQYAETWLNQEQSNPNSPAFKLANELVNEIKSLPNNAPLSTLQNWMSSQFTGKNDVYFQFPGLTVNEAQNLYFITQAAGGTPPVPTPMDILQFTTNYFLQQATNSNDKSLFQEMMNAIQNLPNGSQSTTNDLKNSAWFQNTFLNANDDVYMQYPGVAGQTIAEIFKLMNLSSPPVPTLMDECYEMVLASMQNVQNGNPSGYTILTKLSQLMKSVGSQGSLAQLQNNAAAYYKANIQLFLSAGTSIYNEFFALSGNGVNDPAYNIFFNTINWLRSCTPGTPSYNLAEYVINTFNSSTPNSIDNVVAQVGSVFTTQLDIFATFPGLTSNDVAELNQVLGTSLPTAPSYADEVIAQVYQYLQSLNPNTQDYQIITNLLSSLQQSVYLPINNGVVTWLNSFPPNFDFFMHFPGVSSSTLNLIQSLAGQPLVPTTTDLMYMNAYKWDSALPSVTGDAILAAALMQQLLAVGSNGTLPPNWVQGLIATNFSAYPGLSLEGLEVFFGVINMVVPPLLPLRIIIAQWQTENTQPGTPQYAFAQDLINEINSNPSNSIAQFAQWLVQQFSGAPGTLDVYCQFPGLSQADIQSLVGEIVPDVKVPPPTYLDTIYLQAAQVTGNPQDVALMQKLMGEIKALGNMATSTPAQAIKALQNWFNQTFAANDPYMQFPDADQKVISFFYNLIQMPNSGPTQMDGIYKQAYDYLQNLINKPSPNPSDVRLMNDLLNTTSSIGSFGNFMQLSLWALNIESSNFSAYPGVTEATKTEFENLTGTSLPGMLQEALAWQQSQSGNPNSGAYKLATALVNEIKSLLPNGSIVDLRNWFSSLANNPDDFYMQFPGQPPLSQSDLQNLYNICFEGAAPPPTQMDTRFDQVYLYLLSVSGVNNQNLIQALLSEIRTLGSQGAPGELQNWANSFIRDSAIYAAADPSVKQAFLKFCRQW